MSRYFAVSKECKDLRAMSLVNYEVAMILGCWSAVTVMFYAIIIIVLIPVACFIIYKRHMARTA